MTALFCLFSNTVHAECTPTPDCTELGYTASSCEGGFVRCPFDISKLYCVPCDTKYKYTCSESGQVGSGESCNGKYIECKCADGYELVDGACVVSCAYTLTALPTGCSAVADSCIKNGTTYYSSTCTSCKTGYTLSSGSCKANACSGYYTSKNGCSDYTTCLSGSTTKYKCTACSSGYNLSSNQCDCNGGYYSTGCSSYTTCQDRGETRYKCTACNSGYSLLAGMGQCIDNACYNQFLETPSHDNDPIMITTEYSSSIWCGNWCTGNNSLLYGWGSCMIM